MELFIGIPSWLMTIVPITFLVSWILLSVSLTSPARISCCPLAALFRKACKIFYVCITISNAPWKKWYKSCLNEVKFWEASENHKSSICWKFQLSISCGTQKSAKIPLSVAKMIWSFRFSKPILCSFEFDNYIKTQKHS